MNKVLGIWLIFAFMHMPPIVETSAADREPWPDRKTNTWFASDSIWNVGIGSEVIFEDASSPATKMLHSENVGGRAKSYAWISRDAVPVYQQKQTDPMATWTFEKRSATGPWPHRGPLKNGQLSLKTPINIQFLGDDQYAIIITEDGKSVYEIWKGHFDRSTNSYSVRYIAMNYLEGYGIPSAPGRSEGIRAFGGSLLGGLILCQELEKHDIRHAIAMLLSPTQLKQGKGARNQLVWPASTTDHDGKNEYSGLIPMGTLISIPEDVDIDRLGLTLEGAALAKAYQRYGGYVLDAAKDTMTLGEVEAGCSRSATNNLQKDKRAILKQLRIVANNSKENPGAPGLRKTQ